MQLISKQKARWLSLSYYIRFSILAFVISLALGLLSMGALGAGLYYTILPLIKDRFPPLDAWRGDWVWPAMIGSGMLWSFGFILGAFSYHYLQKLKAHRLLNRALYVIVLWAWINVIWY